ncbi:MAG: hypothetical protein M5U34_42750 [Chloroflexi bacterium]|nr:hypothetical protein [Chloroflexota bacterium]
MASGEWQVNIYRSNAPNYPTTRLLDYPTTRLTTSLDPESASSTFIMTFVAGITAVRHSLIAPSSAILTAFILA